MRCVAPWKAPAQGEDRTFENVLVTSLDDAELDMSRSQTEAQSTLKAERKSTRREFLRVLGAGAAVTATATSLATKSIADSETSDEKRKSRYRESTHVKTYYRVNRYPN